MRALMLAGVALLALTMPAGATLITSVSLFTPQPATGSVTTPIDLQSIASPSQAAINTPVYTVMFNTPGDQGVVRGAASGRHAIPVAGVMNGNPQYLTGNLGEPLTTDAAQSGNYFSTGGAGSTITITFTDPQNSLALLWGSIDVGNNISFQSIAGVEQDVLTGMTVQGLAQNFVGNGFQGAGGSAYVATTASSSFHRVVLSSSSVSFEASALVGSDRAFVVPEPASLALLGAGLLGLGVMSRRRA